MGARKLNKYRIYNKNMAEIEFKIRTSEGESFSKTFFIPPCGSSFSYFPGTTYEENPEFTNNLVLGSGGTNYIKEGVPQTEQIILRVDKGHKNDKTPHLNIDFASTKENNGKRTRKDEPSQHLKMPDWVEIEIIEKEKGREDKVKINLNDKNLN